MCYFCSEVAIEKLTPREFWKLYQEVVIDEDHAEHLIAIVNETSPEYQHKLANEALVDYADDEFYNGD